MLNLLIQLVIVLAVITLGGLLDAIGGKSWHNARRYCMPLLLAIGVSLIVHMFYPRGLAWLTGALVLPACGTLTLRYFSPANAGRAAWIWVQAIMLGLGLLVTSRILHLHLLNIWLFVVYTLLAGVLGGFYKNWKQWKGDWITGSYLCSLVLLVWLTLFFKL